MAERYIVAAVHKWNRQVFHEAIKPLPGTWEFCQTKKELDQAVLHQPFPTYIFFLHWSWKVPVNIIERFECVNFHMTDLPYGRGGSPLQNLIVRGHEQTKLTAHRMTDELDAGPVYMKQELDLSGSAAEIYERASRTAAKMIAEIVVRRPAPKPQKGKPVIFKRRKPAESRLPGSGTRQELYDFIRMLDAPGYPHAFTDVDGLRIEFTDAELEDGKLTARATIVTKEEAT